LPHLIIGGGLSITKLYRFKTILSSREDRYIYLEKPVRIDEIEFRPIGSQKNKIEVLFTVEADSDKEARIKAEKFIDDLCTAILLSTNIAVDDDSIDIIGIQEIPKSDYGRTKTITIQAVITLKDEVSVGLSLSEPHIKSIIEITGKIGSFNELIKRFLRWYRWALLEKDPIDRFTKLWIAFEIWAEYKGHKRGQQSEKAKIVNALMKECEFSEGEAKEMYKTRSALFHSGTYNKALNKLTQLEKCLVNIVRRIR